MRGDAALKPARPGLPGVLRERRLELGLTQGELAKRIGYGDRYISLWERGVYSPRLCSLECWLEGLGMRIVIEPSQ